VGGNSPKNEEDFQTKYWVPMLRNIQNMCRKDDFWDNAVTESFLKTLKAELIYGTKP